MSKENQEIHDIDIVINVLKKHRDDLGDFHEERGGLNYALGALNALRGWAVSRMEFDDATNNKMLGM